MRDHYDRREFGDGSPLRLVVARRVSRRSLRPAPLRLLFVATLWACAQGGGESRAGAEISPFAEDALIAGKVLQNSTACQVDATCYLQIEFADTTVVALYGTGERPAPACPISREVSDTAFQVGLGELISVVVSTCDSDGYYLRRLDRSGA